MHSLPAEIEVAITNVDRLRDHNLLPRTDTPIDRYDEELHAVFTEHQVINITEFDYGRAYRYRIVLNPDPDAAILDSDIFAGAVKRQRCIDVLNISLSLIAPYCLIRYISYRWENGEVREVWTDKPEGSAQHQSTALLLDWLNRHNFQLLDPRIAAMVVEDVTTDLCDEGEATVADCLFFG